MLPQKKSGTAVVGMQTWSSENTTLDEIVPASHVADGSEYISFKVSISIMTVMSFS